MANTHSTTDDRAPKSGRAPETLAKRRSGKTAPEYPVCLDLTTLPPTHNHVIGAVQAITLDNVIGTLALIQRLMLDQPNLELRLSERETEGLTAILENLNAALLFEVSFRERPEDRRPDPDPETDS